MPNSQPSHEPAFEPIARFYRRFAPAIDALFIAWLLLVQILYYIQFASLVKPMIFLLFGVVSYAVYAKDFIPAALGLEPRERFLMRMAPDYEAASFVNQALKDQPGVALVFFRHLYYLRVPFISGDPSSSWLVDPQRLQEPQAFLEELAASGDVRAVASSQGRQFTHWRIEGTTEESGIQILEVRQPDQ